MSDREPPAAEDKITLNFGTEASAALREIATLMGEASTKEAARKMLGDILFIRRRMAKGWRVCLERHGKYEEVVWNDK